MNVVASWLKSWEILNQYKYVPFCPVIFNSDLAKSTISYINMLRYHNNSNEHLWVLHCQLPHCDEMPKDWIITYETSLEFCGGTIALRCYIYCPQTGYPTTICIPMCLDRWLEDMPRKNHAWWCRNAFQEASLYVLHMRFIASNSFPIHRCVRKIWTIWWRGFCIQQSSSVLQVIFLLLMNPNCKHAMEL